MKCLKLIPWQQEHETLARQCKGLAHPVRAKIYILLLDEGEYCVSYIRSIIGGTQSNISQHLSTMKSCGVVVDKRHGNKIHYEAVDCFRLATLKPED